MEYHHHRHEEEKQHEQSQYNYHDCDNTHVNSLVAYPLPSKKNGYNNVHRRRRKNNNVSSSSSSNESKVENDDLDEEDLFDDLDIKAMAFLIDSFICMFPVEQCGQYCNDGENGTGNNNPEIMNYTVPSCAFVRHGGIDDGVYNPNMATFAFVRDSTKAACRYPLRITASSSSSSVNALRRPKRRSMNKPRLAGRSSLVEATSSHDGDDECSLLDHDRRHYHSRCRSPDRNMYYPLQHHHRVLFGGGNYNNIWRKSVRGRSILESALEEDGDETS